MRGAAIVAIVIRMTYKSLYLIFAKKLEYRGLSMEDM